MDVVVQVCLVIQKVGDLCGEECDFDYEVVDNEVYDLDVEWVFVDFFKIKFQNQCYYKDIEEDDGGCGEDEEDEVQDDDVFFVGEGDVVVFVIIQLEFCLIVDGYVFWWWVFLCCKGFFQVVDFFKLRILFLLIFLIYRQVVVGMYFFSSFLG